MDDERVNHPVLKLVSVLGVWVASLTWGELASMAAFVYTMLLIVDWFWKRIGRPLAVRRGWIRNKFAEEFMRPSGSMPLDDE